MDAVSWLLMREVSSEGDGAQQRERDRAGKRKGRIGPWRRRFPSAGTIQLETQARPHPGPMASQARHDFVTPQETNAPRFVIPQEKEKRRQSPSVFTV